MKNNTKCIAIVLLALLTMTNIASFVIAEDSIISGQQSTMEIKPNKFSVQQGEAFDVDLYVKLNTEADTIGVDHLEWDPAIATLDDVEIGNLFSDQTVWIGGRDIDNTKGTLDWMVWGSTEPTNGEGLYAKLKFTALKEGTFSIYIPQEKLVMARSGSAISAMMLGEDSPIQKSTETFLPIGGIQVNQTIVFIGGILVILLIISLVWLYLVKKKKQTSEATTNNIANIEK